MATGAKKGLTPSRMQGSGPDNKGLSEYSIASGYATDLGAGDLVKINAAGNIERGENGSDDNVGVFMGCKFVDSAGDIKEQLFWPASTTATEITAKVMDNKHATYMAVADGSVALVDKGDILPVRFLDELDETIGRSNMEVRSLAQVTATAIDFTGETDIGANTTISDTDAFTVATSINTTGATITIADGDGITDLLSDLNAVTGISAEINEDGSTNGRLTIKASDGGQLRLADSTGTPLVDMGILPTGSTAELRVNPGDRTGKNYVVATAEDFRGETDIGANLTMSDTDAFTVKVTGDYGGNDTTTITIADGDGTAEFLAALNAVAGLNARLEDDTGFLILEAEGNGDLELADSVGTPLADMGIFEGITRRDAGAVRVERVMDADNNVLEVSVV